MLLQSLIDTPEEVERAARRYQELENLYVASGGSPARVALAKQRVEEVTVG